MAVHFLIIVARSEPARYEYLQYVFGGMLDVIFDRRMEERRGVSCERAGADERRGSRRRQHDITQDVETLGWALVRH